VLKYSGGTIFLTNKFLEPANAETGEDALEGIVTAANIPSRNAGMIIATRLTKHYGIFLLTMEPSSSKCISSKPVYRKWRKC
jgi:hypothetical protein